MIIRKEYQPNNLRLFSFVHCVANPRKCSQFVANVRRWWFPELKSGDNNLQTSPALWVGLCVCG